MASEDAQLRVCFVSHSAGLAGAERSLLELVEMLTQMGTECSVILPYKGPLFQELKSRGIYVTRVPFAWWMGSRSAITPHRIRTRFLNPWIIFRVVRTLLNLLAIPLIAAQIRLRQCDVVYTNTITICVGAFAARLLRRPHVWHIREFGFEDHGLTFDLGERFSLRLMDQLSSIVLANSQAVAAKFAPYFSPNKVQVVYGSVVVRHSDSRSDYTLPVPSGTLVRCVIVGSVSRGKGQEDAVLAAGELCRLGIQPVLWIVGTTLDQEYERHLRRLVKDLGMEMSVKFLAGMSNSFPAMLQSDVVLVCSRREAFGRVTVEGMLAGKPVIGTRIGGTLELIREEFNGLLYTPGDYRELARKIRYLHENPDEADRMGKNGREWAQARFSQTRLAQEILGTLRKALVEWYQ